MLVFSIIDKNMKNDYKIYITDNTMIITIHWIAIQAIFYLQIMLES